MRLMDYDEAIGRYYADWEKQAANATEDRNWLKQCFDESPEIDAVPVVRCAEYKHKGWIQEPCHGKSVDFCRVWDSCINNPDKCFCSYGERKDGDGNG